MSEFTLQARRRTLFALGALALLSLALVGRLVELQLFRHEWLVDQAKDRILYDRPLFARRGHIYDSQGRPLVVNEKGYVLWVNCWGHYDPAKCDPEVNYLVVKNCNWPMAEDLKAAVLAGKSDTCVTCARWLNPQDAERLLKLAEDGQSIGVYVEVEPKRVYTYGDLLGPVLGFLQDTKGAQFRTDEETPYTAYGGVEEAYDAKLRGTNGKISMERDPGDQPIPIVPPREVVPARDGANLRLTLDLSIQYMARKRLVEAIEQAGARRGDVLVIDPRTGAILAVVSYPSFDPNRLAECYADPDCRDLVYTNPPLTLPYEPGSTMKIVTMAIALDERLIRPDDTFECTGEAWVDGTVFHNWNWAWTGGAHGTETMAEILLHSCNVGAIHVSKKIPTETYYAYLKRLGFGQRTGVDMANEASGIMRLPDDPESNWSSVDKAVNAFGQGIDVTMIQLASAVGAVANGGDLMQPYIVAEIERGGVVTPTLPTLRAHVLHAETSRQVTEMLVAIAAIKGQNGGPLIPGYRVALKTGTASIPIPLVGGYEEHRTIASAIGYAPADDPRFLILVRIEGNSIIWGEEVAVPVFKDLAEWLLAYLQVPPDDVRAAP